MLKTTANIPKTVKRAAGQRSASVKVEEYRRRIEDLYQAVESWVPDWSPKATAKRIPIEVTRRFPVRIRWLRWKSKCRG